MPLDKALLERIASDDLNLKILSVSDSKLAEEDIAHLVRALKTNTSITHIDFSNQALGDPGIAQLATVLKSKAEASLVSLNLSNTGITDKGLMSILPLLGSAGLATLILQKNKISTSGAELLTKRLQDQRNEITTLDLEGNEITTSAMAAVQSKIKENREIFINLLKATRSGDIENLQSILSMGVVLNQFSTQGYTPLMLAVIAGKLPIIEQLLNLNVSLDDVCLNEKDRNKTVFDFAKESSNSETLKLLYKVAYQRQLARIKKQADTISQEQNRLVHQASLADQHKLEIKVTDVSSNESALQAQKVKLEEQQREIEKLNQQIASLQKKAETSKVPSPEVSEDILQKLLTEIAALRKGQEDLAKQVNDSQKAVIDVVKEEAQVTTLTIIDDAHRSVQLLMAHQEQLTTQLMNHNKLLNSQTKVLLNKQYAEQKQLSRQAELVREQIANLQAIQEVCAKLPQLPETVAIQIQQIQQHFNDVTKLSNNAAAKQQQLIDVIQRSHALVEQLGKAIAEQTAAREKIDSAPVESKGEAKRSDTSASASYSVEQAKLAAFQRRVTMLQTLLATNLEVLYSMYHAQQAEISRIYALILEEQSKLEATVNNVGKHAEQAHLQTLLANMKKFQEQLPKLLEPIEELQKVFSELTLEHKQSANERYFGHYLQQSFEEKLVVAQLTPQQLSELAAEIGKFLNADKLPKVIETLEVADNLKKVEAQCDIIQKLEHYLEQRQQETKIVQEKGVKETKEPATILRFEDKMLDKFYLKLKVTLGDFYDEARLVSIGKNPPRAETTERVIDIIRIAVSAIPIPFLSLAVNLIGGLIEKIAQVEADSNAGLTHAFFKAQEEKVDPMLSSSHIISETAFLATKNYQRQILQLADKGIDQLALCATKRMLGFIVSLDEVQALALINKSVEASKASIAAGVVVDDSKLLAAAKIELLMRGIVEGNPSNLINTSLDSKRKKWTAEGLFKRPGLELEDGSRYVTNPPKGLFKHAMQSRPEKYFYRFGTLVDKKRYKYDQSVAVTLENTTKHSPAFFQNPDVVIEHGVAWHGEHQRSPAAESAVVAAKPRAPA